MFGTDHAFIPFVMSYLHQFLNSPLFGESSDLVWAGVRAILAICTFITAHAVRHGRDRYLAWVALALGTWLGVKVADDLFFLGQGAKINAYFLISNSLWCAVLLGMARMANREQARLKGAA